MLLNFEHLKTFYSALQQKIKSSRGNWQQNDPTADDYIKNRTHYSEGVQEVTVLQYEVDTDAGSAAPMDYAGPAVYYVDFDPAGLQPFVVGQQYSVKWANASYTCVAKMHEGLPVPVLGDVGLLNGYEDTGEPFLIGFDTQEGFGTFMTTKAGKYTVTVTTHQEIVHKLDRKFIDLPENLVTTDKLEEVLPDNIVTTDNIVEALPDNLITSEELEEALPENLVTTDNIADVLPDNLITSEDLQIREDAILKAAAQDAANKDTVILETATQDAANKSAVVLAESQKYTDDKVTEVKTTLSDETETLINEKLDALGDLAQKSIVEKADLAEDVQASLNKADSAVSYEAQTLTEEQKTQARKNLDMYYTEDGGTFEILPSSSAIDTGNAMMGELYVIGSPITLEVGKTYKVIYNGAEYESVASEFTLPQIGLSVGLGDIDVVTTGAPSGAYPFVLAVNDLLVQMGACAAIIPLDGSTNITVSILGKNEIIHYISPQYIKDMYYTEESVEKYILPEITIPSDTDLPLEQPLDIKVGETYICIVDGVEYECTAIEAGEALGVPFSIAYLGNTRNLWGVSTGEPFYFATSANEITPGVYGMAHIDNDIETATVSIKQVKENIHKLDNKYLDLDWIPKIKYAKGNSFYSNDSLSFSSTNLDSGVEIGQQMILDNDFSTITIDDILFISFDEEVYECKASLFTLPDATVICFGNQSIMGIGANTGEPFIIMFTESLGIVLTHSDKIGSAHSIELFTAVNGNPIPTEFLPSDLTATYDMGIDFNHYIGRPFADISAQMNDAYNAYLRGSAVFAKYQSSTGLVLSIFNDTIDAGLNSYLCLATEKGLFCFNGQGSIKVQSITYADLSNLGTLAKKSTVEKTDLATNVQSSLDKADSAILYEAQTLTEEQKAQVRANIGVGTGGSNFSGSYNDLTDKPTINGKTLNQNIVLTSTDVNGVEGRQYGTTNPETGEIEIIVAQAGAEVFNDSINNRAIGECSHAEGKYTIASGNRSHAEGGVTEASGDSSHAEGSSTKASGNDSHAEGWGTKAYGECSHAEGGNTIASGFYSHVQGLYNIEDTENKYIHIVGNGNAQARSNAHTLDWDGNAWYAGNVECTGVIIKSSTVGSTKKFKLTIDDSGVITATEVV